MDVPLFYTGGISKLFFSWIYRFETTYNDWSRLLRKSLNHGGFAIRIYIRKKAVSGRKNTARSIAKMPMLRSIRFVIFITFPSFGIKY